MAEEGLRLSRAPQAGSLPTGKRRVSEQRDALPRNSWRCHVQPRPCAILTFPITVGSGPDLANLSRPFYERGCQEKTLPRRRGQLDFSGVPPLCDGEPSFGPTP